MLGKWGVTGTSQGEAGFYGNGKRSKKTRKKRGGCRKKIVGPLKLRRKGKGGKHTQPTKAVVPSMMGKRGKNLKRCRWRENPPKDMPRQKNLLKKATREASGRLCWGIGTWWGLTLVSLYWGHQATQNTQKSHNCWKYGKIRATEGWGFGVHQKNR